MQKHLYICPKCLAVSSTTEDADSKQCLACNSPLFPVDVDYNAYASLAPYQREEWKKKYVADHYFEFYMQTKPEYEAMPQSGWASYIGCCGWVCLFLCIVGGIFACVTGAFLVGIIAIIAGLASSGSLILFSIVAEDVRHIRNCVDYFHHYRL